MVATELAWAAGEDVVAPEHRVGPQRFEVLEEHSQPEPAEDPEEAVGVADQVPGVERDQTA